MNPNRKSVNDELKEVSPLLAKLKQNAPAPDAVPEGYFEQLPDAVINRIREEERSPVRTARLRPRWIRYAAAASVALLIGAGFFIWQTKSTGPDENLAAELSTQEVESYINENIEDFEMDLLIEYAAQSSEGSNFDQLLDRELQDENLDQYMDEILDAVDLETIEELL